MLLNIHPSDALTRHENGVVKHVQHQQMDRQHAHGRGCSLLQRECMSAPANIGSDNYCLCFQDAVSMSCDSSEADVSSQLTGDAAYDDFVKVCALLRSGRVIATYFPAL